MTRILPKGLESDLLKFKSRHGRKKAEFFVAEGLRCCQEVIDHRPDLIICRIIQKNFPASSNDEKFTTYICDEQQFNNLTFTENAQGIILVLKKIPFQPLKLNDPFLLVLDGIQEPGNLGTILRTAVAVGLREVALTKGTVDPYNPKAIRAGMGAQFNLQFSLHDSLASLLNSAEIKDKNIWLTTPRSGISCYDENFKLTNSVLIFGEEGDGIADLSLGQKVTIPMPGKCESLNVAQAATLFLFEGVRQGLFTS